MARGVSLSASASPLNLFMYQYVGTVFIHTSDYNAFGHEINSNRKNESNDFHHGSNGLNDNELIELNKDGESSNKSLKFDDKSNKSVCSNKSIDKNARSVHNSTGQDRISDPVSTNTTCVKNEIQLKESIHTRHLIISGHASKATNIETERDITVSVSNQSQLDPYLSLIQLTLLQGLHD